MRANRFNWAEVRNPLMVLPSVAVIDGLGDDAREALRASLGSGEQPNSEPTYGTYVFRLKPANRFDPATSISQTWQPW